EDLARASLELVKRGAAAEGPDGIFHITDGGECSWFEFAHAIVSTTNPECRVVPRTTEEYLRERASMRPPPPPSATRPEYSVLDLAKVEALLGPRPSWPENRGAVLPRLAE